MNNIKIFGHATIVNSQFQSDCRAYNGAEIKI